MRNRGATAPWDPLRNILLSPNSFSKVSCVCSTLQEIWETNICPYNSWGHSNTCGLSTWLSRVLCQSTPARLGPGTLEPHHPAWHFTQASIYLLLNVVNLFWWGRALIPAFSSKTELDLSVSGTVHTHLICKNFIIPVWQPWFKLRLRQILTTNYFKKHTYKVSRLSNPSKQCFPIVFILLLWRCLKNKTKSSKLFHIS